MSMLGGRVQLESSTLQVVSDESYQLQGGGQGREGGGVSTVMVLSLLSQ